MTLSPDGGRLAVLGKSGEVKIWSTAERSPRPLRVLPAKEMNVPRPRLLCGREQGRSFRRRVRGPHRDGSGTSGRPRPPSRSSFGGPTASRVRTQAFDPSGRWLVTRHVVDRVRPCGLSTTAAPTSSPSTRTTSRASSSRRTVSGSSPTPNDGTVRVWSLSPGTGAERRLLVGDEYNGDAWSSTPPPAGSRAGGRPHPPGAPRWRAAPRAPGVARRGPSSPAWPSETADASSPPPEGFPRLSGYGTSRRGPCRPSARRPVLAALGTVSIRDASVPRIGLPPGQRMDRRPRGHARSGIVALRFAEWHRSCPGLVAQPSFRDQPRRGLWRWGVQVGASLGAHPSSSGSASRTARQRRWPRMGVISSA